MLSVGDSIADDILKEDLENTSGFLIDQTTDPLDPTPPRKTANGRLGDTLDVVPQHLTMSLGTSLAQSLATFAASPMALSVQNLVIPC